MSNQAYPLTWPLGWRRPPTPRSSRFGTRNRKPTVAGAVDELLAELDRMGATQVVISTNLALRLDGLPRSNQPKPRDTGAAVYFKRQGADHVLPCDTFDEVGCNIYALARTVYALRQMERDGCTQIVGQAFTGFRALPPDSRSAPRGWREVLGYTPGDDPATMRTKYRALVKIHHPDNGTTGDAEQFRQIQAAWDEYDRWCNHGT